MSTSTNGSFVSRREFLRGSSGLLVGAAVASSGVSMVHAAGSGKIRIGLVGCGGRGRGAAVNAMQADPGVVLVSIGDAFKDQTDGARKGFEQSANKAQVDLTDDRVFVGLDAYRGVVENCDVVLLATPPFFRPEHIEAAVDAGIHIFAEKPVATDGPGLRRVRDACRKAEKQNLNVVSGFCYRYEKSKQATLEQIHQGALGDIVTLQCTYNTGFLWHRGRRPDWSDLEWQMRNWLYFAWLSGDHVVEQSCHSIDKLMWAMKDQPPEKVTASGGRIVRTDPRFGNIFDHFNSVIEWPGGVKGFHSCRQWGGADTDVSDYVFGTRATAALMEHRIRGDVDWRFPGQNENMYLSEHKALMSALRSNEVINNGAYMTGSTAVALMIRNSAYTGKTITWEQMWNSQLDLSPPSLEWGPLQVRPVAQPGVTPFV